MGKKSRERRERYQARAQAIIDRQDLEELLSFRSFHSDLLQSDNLDRNSAPDTLTSPDVIIRANNIWDYCKQQPEHITQAWVDQEYYEAGLFNARPCFQSMFIWFKSEPGIDLFDRDQSEGFENAGALVVFTDWFNDDVLLTLYIYAEPYWENPKAIGYVNVILDKDGEISNIYSDDIIPDFTYELTYAVLTTLQFMNCKNIEVVECEPTPRVKSLSEKHSLPIESYKVLKVHTTRKVYQNGDTESDSTDLDPKRLHIVRGNFATYSDEAPLFGKLTGTFWRPAHVRGDEQKGVLIKDYEIEVDSN